jgi:FHA domain
MGTRVVLSLDGAIVTEVELAKPVTTVGRHPECDICIDHPAVSARHMLLRVADRSVFVEDLASTNGTKVNGVVANHHEVNHLDMIEVGKHKLHFFDDSLLVGAVGSLESTVLTDFERTMIITRAPPSAPARGDGDDLSRTMAIPRDPRMRQSPAQEAMGAAHSVAAGVLALRVLSGDRKGTVIALDQANTMIGAAGGESALVVKRGERRFLARFSGSQAPRLNDQALGPGSHAIAERDVIDVGGSSFEVIVVAR